MGMVVQHNMNAINAYNKLNANVAGMKKSSEKLSSGYRINRAGDDAAGLAVSEKMRSQIKGLNQAIRNSQDGINMIQTFEGAAQETHSILQRMKELATQSANGTYDNATDRAAMQLEFDQLNDELNQIADTDFNGTIVLNGGVMSDGLKEVNGDFDYANKKQQLTDEVTQMLNDSIDAANEKLEAAQTALDSNKYDLSSKGAAGEWNTVDNYNYKKDNADTLWKALGLTEDGTGTTAVDLTKGRSVDVTFEYDKTAGTWTAKKGVITGGKNGDKALTEDQLGQFTTTSATKTDANGLGGFTVTPGGSTTGTVNAIFNSLEAKTGDTVTLTFTNAEKTQYAPNNIGFDESSLKIDSKGTTNLSATVSIASGVTDGQMTQELQDAFEGIENVSFEAKYGSSANTIDSVKLGGQDVTLTTTTADGAMTINGKQYYVVADSATAPTKLKIISSKTGADGTTLEPGSLMFDITLTAAGAVDATKGTIKGKISISASKFDDPTASITVKPGDDPALNSSTELKGARDAAQAEVNAAMAKKEEILGIEDADDRWEAIKNYYGVATGVSVSDTFDNSTARLLYTDNIILQTGARSKDAVNFTFNYNGDDTVDMRGLQANLDISSRKNGLNTASLNIANADDANYAMDQIDKAINKVSMVRANFGAMQNRLEHKITNLTTTSENLTEAESTIRDTDMASEMMNYTKFNILQQAAQSMLAQANQQPQSILQLLG